MIDVHPEVTLALRDKRPVVALESAVVTTGLPPDVAVPLALRLQEIVREQQAVPATVAVLDGRLRVGLEAADLQRLAETGAGCKASVRDLAAVMAGGGAAGTTVSATLWACRLAGETPIRVMATGGIGGVHRDWSRHPDVSADLRVLAETAVCVVASGAKSILDVTATLETLETLGVPVLAYRTDEMPQFYCRGTTLVRSPRRVDGVADVAAICRMQWQTLRCATGVLLANPVPPEVALGLDEIDRMIDAAEAEARDQGLAPEQRTPHVLRRIAEQTGGRAVDANTALLADNARLAALVAAEL